MVPAHARCPRYGRQAVSSMDVYPWISACASAGEVAPVLPEFYSMGFAGFQKDTDFFPFNGLTKRPGFIVCAFIEHTLILSASIL